VAYSDTFRAYLKTQGARTAPILTITGPDTTRRYTSIGGGLLGASPRVIEGGWGAIQRSVSEFAGSLQPLEVTVELANTDRTMEQVLEGQYDYRGSAVTIVRGTPDLDSSEWPTIFTGILDSWAYVVGRVSLTLRSDDRALQGYTPKVPFAKSQFQLRNHTSVAEGISAPLVFGDHDSSGLTGTGFVPLVPVDWASSAEAIYCVSLGTVSSVPVVYKNGATVASGFSIINADYGGVAFTVVDFSSSYPVASDTLTADVNGYTADGTTGGAVITNPVYQLWTFLDQFVWYDQRTWAADTFGFDQGNAPIDATSWNATAAKFSLYSLRGARVIGGTADDPRAIDVVDEWLESFPFVRLHWNAAGQIAMSDLLPEHPGYGSATDRILTAAHEEVSGGVRLRYDASSIAKRVTAKCLYSSADSTFVGSVDAQDLNVSEDVTDEIPCYWYEGTGD
jgi:hypothetical protein